MFYNFKRKNKFLRNIFVFCFLVLTVGGGVGLVCLSPTNVFADNCVSLPSFLIKNGSLTYSDGTAITDDEARALGITWDSGTNTLTLEDAYICEIDFENGTDPVEVVLVGENNLRLDSSATPLVISGDGSLTADNGTCPVAEVGMIRTYGDLTINGGTFKDCEIASYGNLTVNGGSSVDRSGDKRSASIQFYGEDLTFNGGEHIVENSLWNGTGWLEHQNITLNEGTMLLESHYSDACKETEYPNPNLTLTINGGILQEDSNICAEKVVVNDGSVTSAGVNSDVFIMNGGTFFSTAGIETDYYFAQNGGSLTVMAINKNNKNDSYSPLRTAIAEFNGGTVKLAGSEPILIFDMKEEYTNDLQELLGDDFEIPTSSLSFNDGDIELEAITKENYGSYYSDYTRFTFQSMSDLEKEMMLGGMCSDLDETNEFIALYGFDRFTDEDDCRSRFIDVYADLAGIMMEEEIESGGTEIAFSPTMLVVETPADAIDMSEIYIDDSFIKDPNSLTVSLMINTDNKESHGYQTSESVRYITFGNGDTVTFSVNENNDIVASENALLYTHIYKNPTYTIIFLNEDGTLLQKSEVEAGKLPVYTGETPTKEATAEYTYTFSGWTSEITEVTEDKTYTATFVAKKKSVNPDVPDTGDDEDEKKDGQGDDKKDDKQADQEENTDEKTGNYGNNTIDRSVATATIIFAIIVSSAYAVGRRVLRRK